MPGRLFDTIGVPVVIINRHFTIESINERACEVLGVREADVTGKKCHAIFHNTPGPMQGCPLHKMLNSGNLQRSESVVQTLNNTFLVTCSPETDENGGLIRIIHTLVDITKQVESEERAQDALKISLQKENAVSTLLEGANAVLNKNNFEEAARSLFDSCCSLIGAQSGYVALLSEDGAENEVLFLEAGGLPCTVDPSLPMPIRGLREQAYILLKPVYDNDFWNSEWMEFMPRGHVRLRNVLFAPIVHNKTAVGLMGLANKPGDFTDEDAQLAGAFAELAAIALLNSKTLDNLTRERERAMQYFNLAGAMFIAIDAQERVTMANARACQVLECSEDEIVGKNWFDCFIPERMRDDVHAVFQKLMRGEIDNNVVQYNNPILTKNGAERLIYWHNTILKNEQEEIIGILGSGEDVTQLKKAVRTAIEAAQKYQNLFEASNEGLLILDENMNIVEVNDAAAELYGYDKNEMIGMTPLQLSAEKENTKIRVQQLKDNKSAVVPRRQQKRKDGSIIHTNIYSKSFNIGQECYYLSQIRDITAQVEAEQQSKKLEQQLFQLQKMDSIGNLAGGIAHDFNNMLTVIMGSAALMKLKMETTSPQQEQISAIIEAVERSKDMTMKLLTFARKEKINVRDVSIREITANLKNMLERGIPKNITISIHVPGEFMVNADSSQIQQALMNICTNSADAMPHGGVLKIEAEAADCGTALCTTCGKVFDGDYCTIIISDTGHGIDENIIEKICEPFFTTKGMSKAAGLGLSVAHGIITNHQGHLHIHSESGKGACVKIFLPLAKSGAAAAENDVSPFSKLSGNETILLVDDEPGVLGMTSKIFKEFGYDLIPCGSGAEATGVYADRAQNIALVVLDLMMPDMDGAQTFRALKEINPHVKVLIASGYSIDGEANALVEAGAAGFVQKPYNITSLLTAVRNALGAG